MSGGTFRQFQAIGARVRKGERATTVVFWRQGPSRCEEDQTDEIKMPRKPLLFARALSVFNSCAGGGLRATHCDSRTRPENATRLPTRSWRP